MSCTAVELFLQPPLMGKWMSFAWQLGNISRSFFKLFYSMYCEESITLVVVFILSQVFALVPYFNCVHSVLFVEFTRVHVLFFIITYLIFWVVVQCQCKWSPTFKQLHTLHSRFILSPVKLISTSHTEGCVFKVFLNCFSICCLPAVFLRMVRKDSSWILWFWDLKNMLI